MSIAFYGRTALTHKAKFANIYSVICWCGNSSCKIFSFMKTNNYINLIEGSTIFVELCTCRKAWQFMCQCSFWCTWAIGFYTTFVLKNSLGWAWCVFLSIFNKTTMMSINYIIYSVLLPSSCSFWRLSVSPMVSFKGGQSLVKMRQAALKSAPEHLDVFHIVRKPKFS